MSRLERASDHKENEMITKKSAFTAAAVLSLVAVARSDRLQHRCD